MLSVFPELFTYALVAPFILRVALGTFFVTQGLRRHRQDAAAWDMFWGGKQIGSLKVAPILTKIQIVIGVLIFVGLYTQVATILAIVFIVVEAYKRNQVAKLSFSDLWSTIFMVTVAASLLFLGAGLLAFDLPL